MNKGKIVRSRTSHGTYQKERVKTYEKTEHLKIDSDNNHKRCGTYEVVVPAAVATPVSWLAITALATAFAVSTLPAVIAPFTAIIATTAVAAATAITTTVSSSSSTTIAAAPVATTAVAAARTRGQGARNCFGREVAVNVPAQVGVFATDDGSRGVLVSAAPVALVAPC